MELTRPYVAAFSSRFMLMLQYRAAALAGFATQCWWGAIKVMVYAAFYNASPAAAQAPISLAQVITYTWLAQGFLALSPWGCDPDIALAVRTGTIGYDRLRPVDVYALWYVRAAGWMVSRALPRAMLMFLLAGIILPLLGFRAWSWTLPPNVGQAALFTVSITLAVALSAAIMMVFNVAVTVTLNDRGVSALLTTVIFTLSGNLLPLALYPDALRRVLFVQPFAGVVDIPFRIYSGNLARGEAWMGIALQLFWTAVIIAGGRFWMERVMRRLQVQGG